MTSPRSRGFLLGMALGLMAMGSPGASYQEWAAEQEIDVPKPALISIMLTPETFDQARPDLADLRLLDPTGQEVPYFFKFQPTASTQTRREVNPVTVIDGRKTRLNIPLQRPAQLRAVTFETPAPTFFKGVTIEAESAVGKFQPLVKQRVLYRQNGVEQLSLPLDLLGTDIRSLRITFDDSTSAPIPITALLLSEIDAPPAEPVLLSAAVVDRTEAGGESRWTVDAKGARVPLLGIRLEVDDPLFMRSVSVRAREWRDGELKERRLASGSIHRLAVEGLGTTEQLDLAFRASSEAREIAVCVENGDSPPLKVRSITLLYDPVRLTFLAKAAGIHRLLSGHPGANGPRYDVQSLATQLRQVTATSLTAGTPKPRADYRRPDGLTDIPILGAGFDRSGWRFTRPLRFEAAGVQRLELPLHALAYTRPDRGDIRLVTEGRQVLYLSDTATRSQVLDLSLGPVSLQAHPRLSRWQIQLPQPRLPVERLRFQVVTPLFEREMVVTEERAERSHESSRRELGRAHWVQTPERKRGVFEIRLSGVPSGTSLWVETQDGDNAPVEITTVQALVRGMELLFQTKEGAKVELAYGNPDAQLPRYDLSLVAPRLLSARKLEARLADNDPAPVGNPRFPVSTSSLFYGILALVVVGLLWIISRLIPSTSSPEKTEVS